MESLKGEITQLISKSTEKLNNEIISLKYEISDLKLKIESLEKSNNLLIKEKNFMILKEFSCKLIEFIENDEFEKLKELIEIHDYPIDEYFYLDANIHLDKSHLRSLNLLHYSIECDKIEFANYLIGRGANVNIPDKIDKWTPLMYAIENENEELVKLLLDKGASVNYEDIDGFTPLAICVDMGNKELIKLIIKSKPQLDKPNKIIPLAKRLYDQEILEEITEYFGFDMKMFDKSG